MSQIARRAHRTTSEEMVGTARSNRITSGERDLTRLCPPYESGAQT